mmetsp:Transcript_8782/g.25749  ORF Transcript_8782/g.25749 Transcript_8782/m.25749 type:complete len:95 (-) Transcript_8782:11-295(-)
MGATQARPEVPEPEPYFVPGRCAAYPEPFQASGIPGYAQRYDSGFAMHGPAPAGYAQLGRPGGPVGSWQPRPAPAWPAQAGCADRRPEAYTYRL